MRYRNFLIIIIALIFLSGAGNILGKSSKKMYVILKKGETIWRIAKRYGCSVAYLCRINNITDVSKVKAGSRIYIRKESSKEKKVYKKLSLSLKLPVKGEIIKKFGVGENIVQLNGIEIKGRPMARVVSSSPGIVKFVGPLRGYGNVVIVQYNSEVSMVYAYLDKIFVSLDKKIEMGQQIGKLGKDYLKRNNILHFELLRDGQPIDPLNYFKL